MTNLEAHLTKRRWHLLNGAAWRRRNGESAEQYHRRIKEQRKEFESLIRAYGRPYIIRYGTDDVRTMWSKGIKADKLRAEVLSPIGTKFNCPLCQPYDNWTGYADDNDNRRYLCKTINPYFPNDMEENGGVWMKCPCIRRKREVRHEHINYG